MSLSTSFFTLEPSRDEGDIMYEGNENMSGPGPTSEPEAKTEQPEIHNETIPWHPSAATNSTGDKVDKLDDQNQSMADDTQPKPVGAAKKKKGTASVVKNSKRAKGGRRSSKTAKKKGDAASSQQASSPHGGEGSDDDSGSESDQNVYCICRGPDNHRFMIACDRCEDWFHGDCVGMDKYTGENLVQRYICPKCYEEKRYVTRYKKTCSLEGCDKPARIYNQKDASIFCCDEHCHLWWEQLIVTLPKGATAQNGDLMTQENFMGLLNKSPRKSTQIGGGWKLGDKPFGELR
jgi:COMPASS component SPP1